jgi:hypothetical protein
MNGYDKDDGPCGMCGVPKGVPCEMTCPECVNGPESMAHHATQKEFFASGWRRLAHKQRTGPHGKKRVEKLERENDAMARELAVRPTENDLKIARGLDILARHELERKLLHLVTMAVDRALGEVSRQGGPEYLLKEARNEGLSALQHVDDLFPR